MCQSTPQPRDEFSPAARIGIENHRVMAGKGGLFQMFAAIGIGKDQASDAEGRFLSADRHRRAEQ